MAKAPTTTATTAVAKSPVKAVKAKAPKGNYYYYS